MPPPLETVIRNQKLCSGTLPGWDLEEIIAIIITDVSPSTIHDSPIHV
jgi:hypothetical protein